MGERHKTILIGIAFVSAASVLSMAVPVLGFFCFIFLPLLMMIYRLRLGRKDAGIVAAAGLAVAAFYSGGIGANIYFLSGMIGLGFFLGEFTEKQMPVEQIVGLAAAAVGGAGFFALLLHSNLSGGNIVTVVSEYMEMYLTASMMLYRDMGISDEVIAELAGAMDEIRDTLIMILPGLFAAALLVIAWINALIARVTFKAKKIFIISDAPLNTWKTPDVLVWALIGCAGLMLIPGGVPRFIGINGLIVLMTIYFFQGIAIVSFYFNKKQIPFFLRVLFYAIIVIQQILLVMVVGLGFFDAWFNFRRIGADPPPG
jgi:uncharacterized protein YybS (DUF2232 family)